MLDELIFFILQLLPRKGIRDCLEVFRKPGLWWRTNCNTTVSVCTILPLTSLNQSISCSWSKAVYSCVGSHTKWSLVVHRSLTSEAEVHSASSYRGCVPGVPDPHHHRGRSLYHCPSGLSDVHPQQLHRMVHVHWCKQVSVCPTCYTMEHY